MERLPRTKSHTDIRFWTTPIPLPKGGGCWGFTTYESNLDALRYRLSALHMMHKLYMFSKKLTCCTAQGFQQNRRSLLTSQSMLHSQRMFHSPSIHATAKWKTQPYLNQVQHGNDGKRAWLCSSLEISRVNNARDCGNILWEIKLHGYHLRRHPQRRRWQAYAVIAAAAPAKGLSIVVNLRLKMKVRRHENRKASRCWTSMGCHMSDGLEKI